MHAENVDTVTNPQILLLVGSTPTPGTSCIGNRN